jgi:hypothetical protein
MVIVLVLSAWVALALFFLAVCAGGRREGIPVAGLRTRRVRAPRRRRSA